VLPIAISTDCWLPSLILGLDHPTSVTGHTYLSFGRLAFLSPINFTHLMDTLGPSRV